ncbi:MAG: NAD(+)--rifampin ADP-ribosyltransferase [Candidatus Kapaibacterium sp.]
MEYKQESRFYHGTKANLKVGDLITPGYISNYGSRRKSNHVYFSAVLESAVWGAELAEGIGKERIYIVEPVGDYEDDPNLTDKKFPGNPTKSFRSKFPLRIIAELNQWTSHSEEQLSTMKAALEKLKQLGIEAVDD